MPKTTFRRETIEEDGQAVHTYKEVSVRTEEVESPITVEAIDSELVGLRSRMKNLLARKRALQSFIGKDIDEGEETYDPSNESVS